MITTGSLSSPGGSAPTAVPVSHERRAATTLEYDAGSLPLPVLMKAMPLFDRLQALEEKTGDVLQDVDAVLRELKSLLESE